MLTIYSREQLVGRWFRQEQENGNQLIEYSQFYSDGTFEFCFITQNMKGELLEQVIELGDWGLVADIHFTLTKNEVFDEQVYAADLENSDNYHAYRVLSLSPDCFEYQHIITNESFILKRVIDNIGHC